MIVSGYSIPKKKAILLLIDLVIILSSVLLAGCLRLGVPGGLAFIEGHLLHFILIGLDFLLFFYIADLYDFKKDFRSLHQILTIIFTSIISLPFSALLIYLYRLVMPGRGIFLLNGMFVTLGITIWRQVYSYIAEHPAFKARTIVVGLDKAQKKLIVDIGKEKKLGLELFGFIHQESLNRKSNIEEVSNIGQPEELEDLVERYQIEQIIVSDNYKVPDRLKRLLSDCILKGARVNDIPEFYQENWQRVPIEHTSTEWLYHELRRSNSHISYRRKIKRLMDVALASLGLVLSSPLYIPISICIKLNSRGPVFYRQERLGKDRKKFLTIKFRTMIKDAEKDSGVVWAKEGDSRITRVGKILRKTRLDELPQFINVLKSDMSMVGPRPEREEFVKGFREKIQVVRRGRRKIDNGGIFIDYQEKIPYYALRLLVKPGITGWAQVKYGYVNSPQGSKEKLEYDLYYILNQSLFLDIRILLKTIKVVLFGKGM